MAEDVSIAANPLKRMQGLLGRKSFQRGQAMIIKPCNAIHTFFMRFPIDVLFLDKKYKIIHTLSCLKPFRATRIYFKAYLTIELPAGAIQENRITVGDTLSF